MTNSNNIAPQVALLAKPEKIDHWYKEPWLLLVIGGPALVVCASILTGIIAMRGADNVVAEDYYKQGLMVNRDIQRDARAKELELSASVELSSTGRVLLNLHGKGALPDSVQVSFASATQDKRSVNEIVRRLRLVQTQPGQYQADVLSNASVASTSSKLLHVKVETSEWRLTGDWFEPSQRALLLKATQ